MRSSDSEARPKLPLELIPRACRLFGSDSVRAAPYLPLPLAPGGSRIGVGLNKNARMA